jgi:hypothetical protein
MTMERLESNFAKFAVRYDVEIFLLSNDNVFDGAIFILEKIDVSNGSKTSKHRRGSYVVSTCGLRVIAVLRGE